MELEKGIIKGETPMQHLVLHAEIMLNGCPLLDFRVVLADREVIFETGLTKPSNQYLSIEFQLN